MREVFQSYDFTEAGYYKSILDAAGIITFIQNQNPPNVGTAFPASLCVRDDDDFEEAIRILKEQQGPTLATAPDWICPSCSESNPANFELCWKCAAPRPQA